MNFLERTLAGFLRTVEGALEAEDFAKANGLLQRLDPRMKVVGILFLIIAVATAHKLEVIAAAFAIALVLGLSSCISPLKLAKRVWIPVLLFTGIIALPAPFVTAGRVVAHLPILGWTLTAQGLRSAGYLYWTRRNRSLTLSVLLILSTPWNRGAEGSAGSSEFRW